MVAQTEDLADLRKRLLELEATIDRRIKENQELMNKIDNWKFHFENLQSNRCIDWVTDLSRKSSENSGDKMTYSIPSIFYLKLLKIFI